MNPMASPGWVSRNETEADPKVAAPISKMAANTAPSAGIQPMRVATRSAIARVTSPTSNGGR